jgi:hypothetical protein
MGLRVEFKQQFQVVRKAICEFFRKNTVTDCGRIN